MTHSPSAGCGTLKIKRSAMRSGRIEGETSRYDTTPPRTWKENTGYFPSFQQCYLRISGLFTNIRCWLLSRAYRYIGLVITGKHYDKNPHLSRRKIRDQQFAVSPLSVVRGVACPGVSRCSHRRLSSEGGRASRLRSRGGMGREAALTCAPLPYGPGHEEARRRKSVRFHGQLYPESWTMRERRSSRSAKTMRKRYCDISVKGQKTLWKQVAGKWCWGKSYLIPPLRRSYAHFPVTFIREVRM